jgi:hypothetical protein
MVCIRNFSQTTAESVEQLLGRNILNCDGRSFLEIKWRSVVSAKIVSRQSPGLNL